MPRQLPTPSEYALHLASIRARRRQRLRRYAAFAAPIAVAALAVAAVVERHRADHRAAASTRRGHGNVSQPVRTTAPGAKRPNAGPKAAATPSVTAPTTAGSLRGRVVLIDPGHNGGNGAHPREIARLVDAGTLKKACDVVGTQTSSGYTEAAYNLDLSLRLERLLHGAGARVVLTRHSNTDWGPCITERAAIGNRAHADVAISIHADGGPPSGRGFHVIYPPSIPGLTDDIASDSARLAVVVRAAFERGTGLPRSTYVGREGLDRRSDLGGLNLSDVPKVFIETGNMRNAQDAALLASPAFREREAQALAAGLTKFLAVR